jgi:hypothetical protein
MALLHDMAWHGMARTRIGELGWAGLGWLAGWHFRSAGTWDENGTLHTAG